MIDPFWLLQQTSQYGSQKSSNKLYLTNIKPTETKEQRLISLRSTFEPLAQLSSKSEGSTKSLIATISRIFRAMSIEDEDETITTADLVGNPMVMKNQKQKRQQPVAMGAPMTKANKAASSISNKEKKKAALSQAAKALGRD